MNDKTTIMITVTATVVTVMVTATTTDRLEMAPPPISSCLYLISA